MSLLGYLLVAALCATRCAPLASETGGGGGGAEATIRGPASSPELVRQRQREAKPWGCAAVSERGADALTIPDDRESELHIHVICPRDLSNIDFIGPGRPPVRGDLAQSNIPSQLPTFARFSNGQLLASTRSVPKGQKDMKMSPKKKRIKRKPKRVQEPVGQLLLPPHVPMPSDAVTGDPTAESDVKSIATEKPIGTVEKQVLEGTSAGPAGSLGAAIVVHPSTRVSPATIVRRPGAVLVLSVVEALCADIAQRGIVVDLTVVRRPRASADARAFSRAARRSTTTLRSKPLQFSVAARES